MRAPASPAPSASRAPSRRAERRSRSAPPTVTPSRCSASAPSLSREALAVGEGDVVGSVGDAAEPYVYLGVRKADEPDGYVDPLVLLPAPAPAPVDPAPVEPDPVPPPVHGSVRGTTASAGSAAGPGRSAERDGRSNGSGATGAHCPARPLGSATPANGGVLGHPTGESARLPEASRSAASLPERRCCAQRPHRETVAAAAGAGPRPVWTAALWPPGGRCPRARGALRLASPPPPRAR